MASTSAGAMPARSRARRAAAVPMADDVSSAAAMRRSRMPVRVWIHSSLVSTSFSRSAFVSTFAGA